mgnify:CR=1 FL=1
MFNLNSPFVKVYKFLFVLQRTSPYINKPGRVVLMGLILEQTVLWTDRTQTYVGGQDSVRSDERDKQQSGGWI